MTSRFVLFVRMVLAALDALARRPPPRVAAPAPPAREPEKITFHVVVVDDASAELDRITARVDRLRASMEAAGLSSLAQIGPETIDGLVKPS